MLHDVLEVLRTQNRFLITTHVRPDGDAIGSQLALGLALEKLDKQVTLLNSDPVPHSLDWLPGSGAIKAFRGEVVFREAVACADAILVVDTNALNRLGKPLRRPVQSSKAVKVLIDHHTEPEIWFDHSYILTAAAATGQLVYEIICGLDPNLIDAEIATALYTAIMTDTGSFRFSAVTADVHRMTADLLERGGLPASEVYQNIYQSRPPMWARLVSMVLGTLTLLYDGELAYMVITQRMFSETNTEYDDAEGMADFAMSVHGVRVVIIFTESRKGVKISFRSVGEIAVDGWARAFGGGGHPNAAGAFLAASLDEVIDRVLHSASRHLGYVSQSFEVTLSQEDEAYLSALTSLQG